MKVKKTNTEDEKLNAAFNVWEKASFKPSYIESIPEKCIEYFIKSFEDTAKVHGKIKRTSSYGGSVFIIYEDDTCYRLNLTRYNNEITV